MILATMQQCNNASATDEDDKAWQALASPYLEQPLSRSNWHKDHWLMKLAILTTIIVIIVTVVTTVFVIIVKMLTSSIVSELAP